MRGANQDAMAIHTRNPEKPLSHDTYLSNSLDQPEPQESTVVSLDIINHKDSHNDRHMDTSSIDSTSTAASPPQLPTESTASSSVSSTPPRHSNQLHQQLMPYSTDVPTNNSEADLCPSAAAVGSLLLLPTAQPQSQSQPQPQSQPQSQPQGSKGLDLWHTWLAQSSDNNGISTDSQVSPQLLLQYLDAVVVPMELSFNCSSSSSSNPPADNTSSLIQTYIKPILQLWQQQQSQTSSVTCYPAVTSVDGKTITTAQQQDHNQRLIQLERLHKDNALNISQLKDQVQQLLRHKGFHGDQRLHNRDTSQSIVVDKSSNNEQKQVENESSTLPQQDAVMSSPLLQSRQINLSEQNCYDERSREAELIAVIVKGLERYHARSLHGHVPHYRTRELQTWCRDEQYAREHHHSLPRRPLSPGAVTCRAHDHELLESSEPDQQPHSQMTTYEAYPDQRHEGFQQEDFSILGQHEGATRGRKRNSSMSGPGALVKENVKQARSCSPLRPRTNSGATVIDGTVPTSPELDGAVGGVGGHVHAQSQPPSSSLTSQTPSSYSSRSTNGTLIDAQTLCKDLSSTPVNYNGTTGYYATQPQHNYQNPRPSRGHKYSRSSQLPRSGVYTDEEYASYQQQRQAYQYSEESATAAPYGGLGADQNYSPYFHTTTNVPYRGKHSKNQASLSSQYSTAQHQYQRNDPRAYHGYDQLQQPQLSNYLDHQDEDVKPHYQQKNSRQDPGTPIYVMNRQVNTVPELWKEWTVGLGPGNPSIRQLEAQYGPSWRTSSSAANFFSRRLRIINEIQRLIDFEGLTEEEAVNRLEARREQGVVVPGTEGVMGVDGQPAQTGGMSLHRLSEILRKKQT